MIWNSFCMNSSVIYRGRLDLETGVFDIFLETYYDRQQKDTQCLVKKKLVRLQNTTKVHCLHRRLTQYSFICYSILCKNKRMITWLDLQLPLSSRIFSRIDLHKKQFICMTR